jgi:DUF4097 and DUF4098 domain-containing protein YvlB
MPARSFNAGLGAISLVLAGLLVSGCGSSVEKAVEQTTEQEYPIDPDGTLVVRNSSGSIAISGSDDSVMKLKAIRKAWNNTQLGEIGLHVSALSGSVSVETSFPPRKWSAAPAHSAAVDYTISMPRTVKTLRLEIGNGDVAVEGMASAVRVNLLNGALTVRNCFGNAELSVANGGLDLFYEKWKQKQFSVEAKIISGNARALLPAGGSFHVVAEAPGGNVTNQFEMTEKRPRRATRVNLSTGGEGSPEIVIRATQGNIEIASTKPDT